MTKIEKPYLAVDLDDVTAKCNERTLEIYNKENGTNYALSDITSWDFNDGMLCEVYSRPDLYANLELVEGALEGIKTLQEYFDVVFVTAAPNGASTLAKYEWVESHFPSIGFSGTIATKHKHLVKAFALIDDSPINIRNYKNGYRILVDAAYNQDLVEGIDYDYRVKGWEDIVRILLDLHKNTPALSFPISHE